MKRFCASFVTECYCIQVPTCTDCSNYSTCSMPKDLNREEVKVDGIPYPVVHKVVSSYEEPTNLVTAEEVKERFARWCSKNETNKRAVQGNR